MNSIFKKIAILGLSIAITMIVVYFISCRVRDVGLLRATVPCFLWDVKNYGARIGGLTLIDISKIFAFAVTTYFAFVFGVNTLSEKIFPPSAIALNLRETLSTITKVPKELIETDQPAPEWLRIYSNPKIFIDENFCRENEWQIEAGCGIDVLEFRIAKSGEVLIKFRAAKIRLKRMASIWHERKDGSLVQDTQSHGFGYAIHDGRTMKVGFADSMANAKFRINERRRHCPGSNDWKYFVCKSRREETAIKNMLRTTGAALADPGEAGNEVFDFTAPAVRKWFDELEEIFEG